MPYQDAEIIYINKQTAEKKLYFVARKAACDYLINNKATKMFEKVRDDNSGMIDTLWPFIKDNVQQTLEDEFRDLKPETISDVVKLGENIMLQKNDLNYIHEQLFKVDKGENDVSWQSNDKVTQPSTLRDKSIFNTDHDTSRPSSNLAKK